jgi:hypothetical protein
MFIMLTLYGNKFVEFLFYWGVVVVVVPIHSCHKYCGNIISSVIWVLIVYTREIMQ